MYVGAGAIGAPRRSSGGRKSVAYMHASIARKNTRNIQLDALGTVSLVELDPETTAELSCFRAFCTRLYSNEEDVWRALLKECVETNFNARLWKVEFSQAVHMIGYTGDAQLVF